MSMTRSARLIPLLAALVFGIFAEAACSSRKPKLKAYPAEVTGVVSLDGKPMSSGTITFISSTPESQGGRPGLARIEKDGSYRVGNSNERETAGLKPDRYKVTVLAMSVGGKTLAELTIPEVYTSEKTTPFEVKVVEGPNRCDFELKSSPPPAIPAVVAP